MKAESVPSEVLAEFYNEPAACRVTSLGFGNINDTYLVQTPSDCFVLQKINGRVFPEPLRVIKNFSAITNHLAGKKTTGRQELLVAVPVLTRKKQLFCCDSHGAFWRGQSYLPHKGCRVLASPGQARRVGVALATFHRLIGDLDGRKLVDPLPGFHDLPGYLESYDRAIRQSKSVENGESDFCLATIDRYRPQAATLVSARDGGILSVQPIHGDPKIDNFIFNDQGDVLGLLDLDTVAMGLLHYDLGDCLRSCCNRGGEAGDNALPITFDLSFCHALLDGYFSGPDKLLTKEQRGFIFDGVLLICFELGVRFFTDHLLGNPYFKVQRDGDNLLRAVNQFRLADNIVVREKEIRAMALSAGASSG
jgi:hypothetical protein